MRIALIRAATILGLLTASRAEAGILYSTTDIGTSYQFLTGSGGQEYGVTGSTEITYVFDKSPVTKIDIESQEGANFYRLYLQSGSYKVGFGLSEDPPGPNYPAAYPSFMNVNSGWNTSGEGLPVNDINIQGQVVGVGLLAPVGSGTFAAFSAVGEKSHGGGFGLVVDNLNNYITTIPGATLTSAVAIDDLGRIMAYGSNGHAYLLTPVELGAPATVPEPSTALMMGLAGSLFGLRSVRRQWVRRVACSRGA
jgi:PEP-CTERM motif